MKNIGEKISKPDIVKDIDALKKDKEIIEGAFLAGFEPSSEDLSFEELISEATQFLEKEQYS